MSAAPELVAVHARPNENAWILGYAYRVKLELVGARGFEPPGPITRIVIPKLIAAGLRAVA